MMFMYVCVCMICMCVCGVESWCGCVVCMYGVHVCLCARTCKHMYVSVPVERERNLKRHPEGNAISLFGDHSS